MIMRLHIIIPLHLGDSFMALHTFSAAGGIYTTHHLYQAFLLHGMVLNLETGFIFL